MAETREQAAAAKAAPMPAVVAATGHYRWMICALLFFAATVNYIDRQVIGLLKPTLQQELRWSEIDYSDIVFHFQLAYAIGLVAVGRVMDWLGTRKGFSLAVLLWSAAAVMHAFVRSVFGFCAARFALGLGESGSFPASIKTVAEWFPKRERALAQSVPRQSRGEKQARHEFHGAAETLRHREISAGFLCELTTHRFLPKCFNYAEFRVYDFPTPILHYR
jgi:sugar phosphate permease